MFKRNLLSALAFIGVLFVLYKICVWMGLPLYPYGMLLFLLPLFGLIPVYQYLEFKQLNGYKQHLINAGICSEEQLNAMSSHEIEQSWKQSLMASSVQAPSPHDRHQSTDPA
jgi:hypothetical protein